MFTPEELEFMPRKIEKLYSDLEWRIMMDIVRRLQMAGEITRSADWQIYRLSELGKSKKEIKKFIREILSLTEKEIDKIYEETIASGYARNQALYEAVGKEFIPYTENMVLQQMVQAIKTQTLDQLQNITQSMGFARKVNGKIEFTELADFYQKTLDNAVRDITSGAFDYNAVLRRTIDTMTESGLRSMDYASGWSNRVEVAARRALMTGVSQVTGRIHEQNAKKLGIDMYEVTRHRGARPDHQPWQGKCFNMEELKSVCGYGKVDGLKGANCYHDFHEFYPGISKRIYTDEELDRLNAEENIPKEWHGKEYTAYEATQKQRRMETTIRAWKRKINLLEEGGADPDTITAAKCRWRKKMGDYADFSETMKLPEQRERLYIGKVGKQKKGILENSNESSRIETISDIEIKAIQDYMSAKSYIVNDKLRKGVVFSDEEKVFVEKLEIALNKMPTYKGNLQRSLLFYHDDEVENFMELHKKGGVVKYKEFISTTKGEIYNPEGQVQIYIRNSRNGKDISVLNSKEDEVLYNRNTSFEIINVVKQDGKYYILMEEYNAE